MHSDPSRGRCPEAERQAELRAIVALHQAGDLTGIETRARSLTARYPADVLGHAILGSVYLQQDRGDLALPCLDLAVHLSPGEADIHNNRGIALLDCGRPGQALESFQTALALRPDHVAALCNQGGALEALGRLDEAMESYRRALALCPDHAKAHYNLGNACKDLGRLDEALDCYQRAIDCRPDYVQAMVNRGIVLLEQGHLAEAEALARQALRLAGSSPAALNLLASTLLLAQDDPTEALDALVRSLWLAETPDTRRLFVACAKRLEQAHMDPTVSRFVIRAMTEPWARSTELVALGTETVLSDPEIAACVSRAVLAWPHRLPARELFDQFGLESVCQSDMLRALLVTAPICGLELERFCTLARSVLLEAGGKAAPATPSDELLAFWCALARQCHINEYMFDDAEIEAGQARDLGEVLDAALAAGRTVPVAWPLAVACYLPLDSLRQAEKLLARDWPEPVRAVLAQQISASRRERELQAALPRLTAIDDAVSCLVRQQYEENPYPRWVLPAPMGEPVTFDAWLREHHPQARFTPLGDKPVLDILIAGCGTGQHTLETARRFRGAKVLAVDLSLASLAYASRKTEELGLTNIAYAQADILRLDGLAQRFDIIESSGVLHHLADPLAGWRVLLSLLRPGGCMRIGLYSRVARRDITRARARLAAMGYAPTTATIRRCRQELMDQQRAGEDWKSIFMSDFYSISGCRDLLFHVQEHCLTLESIGEFLDAAGLTFLGFELDSRILADYQHRHPEDRCATCLEDWAAYERQQPDTFLEMYQFWVQKPA